MLPVPRISIVIPVYNEQGIVREACTDLVASLDARSLDYEILLSENGSSDRTVEILEQLSVEYPRVRYLRTERPNYGLALRRGILEARGQYVLCDEIDLCDVRFYDRALPMLEAGQADMVVGSKRAPGAADNRPAFRRFATFVHNTILRILLGFRGTDTHGPKALLRERIAPTAIRCVVDRDVFASELVLRAGLEGKRVVEIPIVLAERRPPSVHLLRRVPNVLRQVARLVWVLRIRAPVRARRDEAAGRPEVGPQAK
jgi:glycosyltransferase involved in cell wall biosynthesis